MEEWYSNPLVWFGFLTASAVIVGVIFGFGQWKGKVDTNQKTLRRDVNSTNGATREFMAEIRADIKRIFERLPPPEPVTGMSPLRLSELGRSISERLGTSSWAEELAPQLIDQVTAAGAYDIQVFAYKYVEEKFTPDPTMEATIKQCAYENGLRVEQIRGVFAIELRDQLLSMRQLEPQDPPSE